NTAGADQRDRSAALPAAPDRRRSRGPLACSSFLSFPGSTRRVPVQRLAPFCSPRLRRGGRGAAREDGGSATGDPASLWSSPRHPEPDKSRRKGLFHAAPVEAFHDEIAAGK